MTDLVPHTIRSAASSRLAISTQGRLRRLGAPLIAVAIAVSLAACGATGAGSETGETNAAAGATAGATTASSECADVAATLTAVQERLNALPDKIPSDIPGAIEDVQVSVDELTTLSESVEDAELKQLIENVITRGTEALTILEQARSGEITPIEAGAQGMSKLGELQSDLGALSEYCAGVA
ncbi:MAG: hypothetical protein ACTH31_14585 [Pseudoclavibacter sp.]